MKNAEVHIGGVYWANVSGRRVKVRVTAKRTWVTSGGWLAQNLDTGRMIVVMSGQRLLGEVRKEVNNGNLDG